MFISLKMMRFIRIQTVHITTSITMRDTVHAMRILIIFRTLSATLTTKWTSIVI